MSVFVKQAQYVFIHDALVEYVTCGNTEFSVRELPEKLRILNTVDPDGGNTLLVGEFKVSMRGKHAGVRASCAGLSREPRGCIRVSVVELFVGRNTA